MWKLTERVGASFITDVEGDASAEIDLLGEDDHDTRLVDTTFSDSSTLDEVSLLSSLKFKFNFKMLIYLYTSRRGSIGSFSSGRGMSRDQDARNMALNPNLHVPITRSASPVQPNRENPARVYRRAPVVVVLVGSPSVISDQPVGASAVAASPIPPLMRGRGVARGRSQARASRRM